MTTDTKKPPKKKNPAKISAPKTPKTGQSRKKPQTKPQGRGAKETLEEIPFLTKAALPAARAKEMPLSQEFRGKKKKTAKREFFQKENLPVLSQKKKADSVSAAGFADSYFETYSLHHWGKINLCFLLPASISPPLLGLWLTPAGMTAGFAVLIFLAVLAIANLLSFLLILFLWALKGK